MTQTDIYWTGRLHVKEICQNTPLLYIREAQELILNGDIIHNIFFASNKLYTWPLFKKGLVVLHQDNLLVFLTSIGSSHISSYNLLSISQPENNQQKDKIWKQSDKYFTSYRENDEVV